MAMFDEFNKTQQFADQKGTVGFVGPKPTEGVTRLPGPHYILENAAYGVAEQEKRTRAADAAAADRWFQGPEQASEPSPYAPAETDFDSEYGPPGVPLLLAVARSSVAEHQSDFQPAPEHLMYGVQGDPSMWLSEDMPATDNDQFLGAAGASGAGGPGSLPMLQMDATEASMMFPPPPAPQPVPNGTHAPGPPAQFVHSQPGMFMDGYPGQYPDGNVSSAPYMQGTNFG